MTDVPGFFAGLGDLTQEYFVYFKEKQRKDPMKAQRSGFHGERKKQEADMQFAAPAGNET